MAKDFYAILGVKKDASEDDIKKSFRRLAHEHHPDKGGDQQKFKDINEAYQVLGDAKKRATYDQYGSAAFEQGGMGGGPQGFGGFGGFNQSGFDINFEDMGDLGDILGGMFGFQGGGGGRKKRGADIQTDLTIDFLEAVHGVTKTVKLHKNNPCSTCSGSGAKPGSNMDECKTCKGKGQVEKINRTVFGSIQTAVTCPDCQGKGKTPSEPCKDCDGTGVERKTREFQVAIPAGISDSEGVRIGGEGEFPGAGGHAGDLIVRIRVRSHPHLEREGNDILSRVEVPYSTLALGGETEVETVDGEGSLKVPEGTQAGTVFKLRGKGVPYLHGAGRGDHLVTVMPQVNRKLTKEQRAKLDDLRQAGL